MYRIHRMRETPRLQFRWAPHTGGATSIKPRDFEPGGVVVADSCYDAWMSLRGTAEALDIGDILQSDGGDLRICKYVGFEEARWVLPEIRTGLEQMAPASGSAAPPSPQMG